MPITAASIADWMEWAAIRQLTECVVTVDGHKITIRRHAGTAPPQAVPVTPDAGFAPAANAVAAAPDDMVIAPLAGLCHLHPDAGAAPFVTLGAHVEAGQTICIIEAMKMMTAIPAPHAGRVQAIIARDGAMIGAGAPLMRIA